MKRHWRPDELVDHWTIQPRERELITAQKAEHTCLGFAVLLKYAQLAGRFPRSRFEVPPAAIVYLAQQLKIPSDAILSYDWESRTIKYHRAAIRSFLGLREATVADQEGLTEWLVAQHLPQTHQLEALTTAVLERCRVLHLEPPTPDRVERLVRSAIATYDTQFYARIAAQLSPETRQRLDALLQVSSLEAATTEDSSGSRTPLQALKRDPGPLSVQTTQDELTKLTKIAEVALPAELFAGIAPRILTQYRQRVVTEEVHALRRHPDAQRWTILAAYCWVRRQETIDTLADILIEIVQHIGARAERKVQRELLADFQRVTGKTSLLFQIAEAAVSHPDEPVRAVLFPVVSEQTLHDLVKEYRATGPGYQQRVYTVMRGSYQHHYRQIVPLLLQTLDFQSNNAAYQPIRAALALLARYASTSPRQAHFPAAETVPLDGVIKPAWQPLVVQTDEAGVKRVNRINYEIGVLHAVREKLRCKELWLVGADRFRNPDDDLPADFAAHRDEHYAALNLPQDATVFTHDLQERLRSALQTLNDTLPANRHVTISDTSGGWIKVSPLEPQAEPPQLPQLKADLTQRWTMLNLLDILKETDLRVHVTDLFQSPTGREHLDRATLQRRLLLCLYGLGTNIGLKRVGSGEHGESYRDLLYVRRRFITRDALRAATAQVVNHLLAVRLPHIWGEGTTACAADSKKFSAWDQNLLTEWSVRHRGPGIMIYWHVERKAACIYSQLKSCTSSEVAAMITGVIRHCTEMSVQRQYVDSHGQSEVAFAFCNLLGFQLLPRLKGIHRQKLYRPEAGAPDAYPNLQPVLTRPIKWELIQQQYEEIVKYVTAVRLGTAEPEAIRGDRQVRDRSASGDSGARGDLAALHAHRGATPHLPGAGGGWEGLQDDLPVRVSAESGAAAGDPRGLERRRALEQREHLHLLRAEQRDCDQPAGGSGDSNAVASPAPAQPGVYQHAVDPAGAA